MQLFALVTVANFTRAQQDVPHGVVFKNREFTHGRDVDPNGTSTPLHPNNYSCVLTLVKKDDVKRTRGFIGRGKSLPRQGEKCV